MKIFVMSDSHGNTAKCIKATHSESPDLIVHLGDYQDDAIVFSQCYPDIPLYSVKGNCDMMSQNHEEIEFEFGGMLFYITHGHLHNVKTGLAQIVADAKRREVNVALFGHTHIPYYDAADGIVFVNPGSIAKTYATLTLKDGAIVCDIKSI